MKIRRQAKGKGRLIRFFVLSVPQYLVENKHLAY